MAVLLPALISIGTGAFGAAAGAIAAGTAGFAAYATVAGTLLTGIGALTGSKDMLKLGGILSLGAGVAGAFGAGASGGATAAEGFRASELAADAGGAVSNGADLSFMADGTKSITTGATGSFDAAAAAKDFGGQINTGLEAGKSAAMQPGMAGQGLAQTANEVPGSIMTRAADSQLASQQLGYGGAHGAASAPAAVDLGSAGGIMSTAAKGVTQADISAYLSKAWQEAQNGLRGIGQFAKDNKELVQMGGMALQSAYGPEAEKLDYQKSIMERSRRNLNSPVKLNFGGR